MAHSHSNSFPNIDSARVISVVSYLTIVGWLIAIVVYGKHRSCLASFHLRQSLGLILTAAVLSFVPLFGWLFNCVLFIVWLVAIYYALRGERFCVPVVGFFFQEKLAFIR